MSLTFQAISEVKDDELFIMTGKDLKALLEITKKLRCGPTRNDYFNGGALTRIVCNTVPCPDFKTLVETKKE